jgi:2-deoxy-D-gluconate 3-dehydrogenase
MEVYMTHRTISQLFDLTGKTAVVTGGSVGIGRAIAERLAEAGAAVVIADVDTVHGDEVTKELTGQGRKAVFARTDIRNLAEIDHTVETALKAFGSLDILVNNAGIFPFMPVLDLTEASWDQVLDTNLKGSFFFAQKAAKKMVESGRGGRIINIVSIDALHPTGNLAHYDSSKGGLVMLTKSLALEWGRYGILVNAIAPGGIQTPGAAQATSTMVQASGLQPEQLADLGKTFTARIPLGRQGDPDEIATVALFLAGEAARYITGETIVVDGGYLLS